MGAVMGKDGSVQIVTGSTENKVALLDTWTLSRSVGTAEITAFGSTWEDHDPTIRSWTASVAGTLDSTDTEQLRIRDQLENATLANLAFYFFLSSSTAGAFYNGNAIVESDTFSAPVKDKISWSATLRGDGALSWTAAT